MVKGWGAIVWRNRNAQYNNNQSCPVTLAECFLVFFFFQMVIRNADENAV